MILPPFSRLLWRYAAPLPSMIAVAVFPTTIEPMIRVRPWHP
jgi:hypothetical protein